MRILGTFSSRTPWSGLLVCCLAGFGISNQAAFGKNVVVKFRSEEQLVLAFNAKSFADAAAVEMHAPGKLMKVTYRSESTDIAAQLRSLAGMEGVDYAVEDMNFKLFDAPPKPSLEAMVDQWSLATVHAQDAWRFGVGSKKVVVAVIDTGTDIAHKDLAANIYVNPREIPDNGIDDDGNGFVDDVHGWNFIDDNSDVEDVVEAGANPGHGTHCAGIIGSLGRGDGTFGINQQVSIMPLRFIGPGGGGDLFTAIKAIDYAILMKADVISASWGAQTSAAQAQPLIEAIGRANAAGIIFVAAAGNDGLSNDEVETYPANAPFPNVVAVAASDRRDERPYWSNYGRKKVAIAAPGADILSTLPHDMFGPLSGTSMAAPMVAGLFGLLKADALDHPERAPLSASALIALVQSTGHQVAIESACMCRIDAVAAASAIATNQLFVVPAASSLAVGSSLQLTATGGHGPYAFSSNNPAVLSVGADGKAAALGAGTADITVTDATGKAALTPHYIVNSEAALKVSR